MKNIAVVFGGQSVEHEVSLISSKNVMKAIDRNKYRILPIGIDKTGGLFVFESENCFLNSDDPKNIQLDIAKGEMVTFALGKSHELVGLKNHDLRIKIDIIFPILHGNFGEDGTIQSLFKLANIPFVGSSILGSAIGMDKDITKRLLNKAGILTAKSFVFRFHERSKIKFVNITNELGLPLFVKPANAGSSVGISRVSSKEEFEKAVALAFEYDRKILIEEAIKGREIECAILGNENPIASLPGEIVPKDGFYSYKAKYLDKNGADLIVPVELPKEIIKKIQDLSLNAFRVIDCEGMARVDGFLTKDDRYLINELNTIPGFTNISMYPKLWEASGITYKELTNRLIDLAIDRFEKENKLKTSYTPNAMFE